MHRSPLGNRVRLGVLLVLLLALALPLLPARAQVTTDGWSGTVEPCGNGFATQTFGPGPASPPHGTGSLQFSVAAVDDGKVWSQFVQRGVVETPLTAISQLRYWTFVSRGAGHAPHLFLDVDLNGDGVADDRLIYQPELNGTVTPLTWQEWSAAGGRWWSQRGLGGLLQGAPGLLTSYALAFPNARLALPEGGQGGLGIGVGCLGSGWGGWQGAVDALVFRAGTLSFFWDFEATGVVTTRGGGVREGPTFRDLRPAPWSTVAPGPVTIAVTATTPSGLRSVRLSLDGRELPVTESGDRNTRTVSTQLTLQPGFFVVTAIATDELGRSFTAQWQFVVSPDPRDSWWFRADGTPRQQQITASLRALSEAFRWHFFGYSWDGAYHPEMPTHASVASTLRVVTRSPMHFGTLSPTEPIMISAAVVSSESPLASVELTLNGQPLDVEISRDDERRWLVYAIRTLSPGTYGVTATVRDTAGRRFTTVWGFVVSSDANENPWFYPDGRMKAEVVTRTLRTLVEGWRWHTRGQSWDGKPHPEFPTHSTGVSGAEPLPQWFDAQGRPNQQAISDTLRMLEQEFRWHFWGISWDGNRHPEIPTHAD
ncbi:hypothetical protein [Thermomicrobium sp.]|uniref:hypothetical protein n=1 Tax=Thermomicrobium sp. TaxID=1969469 RepID=UPI001B2C8AE8|nr:hypothetical protein [Thermomicrobium sp.]MBO9306644.1 hypothetical protein [Thermomicrobium sp.]MBO9359470.1 hypothetical protein [Thermomicrobium sp.]